MGTHLLNYVRPKLDQYLALTRRARAKSRKLRAKHKEWANTSDPGENQRK